jgi:hypothetical protein
MDDLPKASNDLVAAVNRLARKPDGRVRCEDAISDAAAFLGEATLRRAGDFDFERHTHKPGQPVSSAKVTGLLSGDLTDWEKMPARSVFRAFYVLLTNYAQPWSRESFPDVAGIFSRYAMARRGGSVSPRDRGRAPLSVPPQHCPVVHRPPLRAAFELRQVLYTKWTKESLAIESISSIAEACLLSVMVQTRSEIAADIALLLMFETINAMARTAPILSEHAQANWLKRGIHVPNMVHARPQELLARRMG